MEENSLLHPNHHAYCSGHNTTTAMIQMYDSWINMIEDGQLGGVCMLDMSAAFDVVDHDILLEKLSLYGFEMDSLSWIRNYLTGRSQCVLIEGSLSNLLSCEVGVPQGSILGPLFYTIYTNELPEVIHTHSAESNDLIQSSFNLNSSKNGNVCCYADDTTLSCSAPDPLTLSQRLEDKYRLLSDFMLNNRLKLNDTKTQLLIIKPGVRNYHELSQQVLIKTSEEDIRPCQSAKLLGCWVTSDLTWKEHLRNNNSDNLLSSLNKRAAAIRLIGKLASFKTRKMIANGIYFSKLSYLIALWGGCGSILRNALQVSQNKVARIVTKLPWTTPTSVLLQQCGWLSVNQLIFYHSVLMLFKVKKQGYPKYLFDMHKDSEYSYSTRQATNSILKIKQARLELSRESFRWRAAQQFNLIPKDIRDETSIDEFKSKVKSWIKTNIVV